MTKKAIVADDRPDWREMYVNAIHRNFPSVVVDEVESGSDLVNRVLQGDYSLVISDNDMEEKNAGLKALQKIRESGNNVPFYLVSGGSSDVARNALRNGANGFYDKADFDSDKVLEGMAQYLQ